MESTGSILFSLHDYGKEKRLFYWIKYDIGVLYKRSKDKLLTKLGALLLNWRYIGLNIVGFLKSLYFNFEIGILCFGILG